MRFFSLASGNLTIHLFCYEYCYRSSEMKIFLLVLIAVSLS